MTAIQTEERTLAALTHLSGFAGYVVPLGGVLVPILIWVMKSDSPAISGIARQALLLNVVAFLVIGISVVLMLTVILIPVSVIVIVVMGLAQLALPIIGAIKAADGEYFRYPVIG